MTVQELIDQLELMPAGARVFMGYDGNIVVEESLEVEEIQSDEQIGDCWCSVKVGDVVILAK